MKGTYSGVEHEGHLQWCGAGRAPTVVWSRKGTYTHSNTAAPSMEDLRYVHTYIHTDFNLKTDSTMVSTGGCIYIHMYIHTHYWRV